MLAALSRLHRVQQSRQLHQDWLRPPRPFLVPWKTNQRPWEVLAPALREPLPRHHLVRRCRANSLGGPGAAAVTSLSNHDDLDVGVVFAVV